MTTTAALGIFLAGLLTLAIYSFLYKDNPLYKFAEHLFVGTSAGYWFISNYYNILKPNVITAFGNSHGFWEYFNVIIPTFFGILMLARLIPKVSWISRWAIAFSVGISVGLNIMIALETNVMKQIGATLKPFESLKFSQGFLGDSVNAIIILISVVTVIIYFYFSKEHTGAYGKVAKLGIWVLMLTFGASFGYTVMARISLLIGRIQFLQNDWWNAIKYLF